MSIIPNKQINKQLHFMFIGAHPDDGDIESCGTAIKYLQLGHKVTFVSMTNGDAGHYQMGGTELAKRRRTESLNVAKHLGINYIVLDNSDAKLHASIEQRDNLIRLIRHNKPDIIVTHRPNDYHSDHRNTSLIVQDTAYLIAVPNICPEVPRLEYNPVILFHQDSYTKPYGFSADIIVDISEVYDKKIESLSLHESQVYEWLPFIEGYFEEVPSNKADRLDWLKTKYNNPGNVNRFLKLLPDKATYIEAFEISEYGGQVNANNFEKLFPFGYLNKELN